MAQDEGTAVPAMAAAPESSAEESSDEEEAPVLCSLHPHMTTLFMDDCPAAAHSPFPGRSLSGKCLLIFMCQCFDSVPPAGTCTQAKACATVSTSHPDLREQEKEEEEAGGHTELQNAGMRWSRLCGTGCCQLIPTTSIPYNRTAGCLAQATDPVPLKLEATAAAAGGDKQKKKKKKKDAA